MTEAPLFSILVPCCDVAPYVGECVASLKGQDVPFEAICVVEESRDDTENVLRAAVAGDARFTVVTEPRSGSPSTPRNTGLARAKGEYVILLDGDDTLAPAALADLADWIARYPGTDLFPCAARDGGNVRDNYPADLPPLPLTGAAATRLVSAGSDEPLAMATITVYRRAFLDAHALRFVDGLRHEDEEFTPRALYLAETVVPTHLPFYLYRRRADSIMTAIRERNLDDLATVYGNLLRFHAERHPSADVSRAWARNWFNTLFSAFFFTGGNTTVTPAHRKGALKRLFANGFGDFDALVRFATRPKRLAASFIRFAVRTGWYTPATVFFRRLYYPLAMRRVIAGRKANTGIGKT